MDNDEKAIGASRAVGVESGRATSSAVKNQTDPDQGYTDLYKLNQIWYRMPPQLSLVSKRTLLQNQAQRSMYTNPMNDTIVFIFNTGEFYVNMSQSYMYLQLGYNNQTNFNNVMAYVSQGNILDLFEEVVFTSSSGTEVCRELNKGLHNASSYRYKHNQEYINTYGQVQAAPLGKYWYIHQNCAPTNDSPSLNGIGLGGVVFPHGDVGGRSFWGYGLHNLNTTTIPSSSIVSQGTFSCIIPMEQILGCFKTYMNVLTPAGFLAGGRLEIRLKNMNEGLQFVTQPAYDSTYLTTASTALLPNVNSAFTINQIYIQFDAFQMNDAVLKRLVQIAAGTEGLTMMFDTFDYAPTGAVTNGAVEAQVTQARSRMVRSWVVCIDDQNRNNPYINSFASEPAILRITGGILPGQPATSINFTTGGAAGTTSTAVSGNVKGTSYVLSLEQWSTSAVSSSTTTPALLTVIPALPADNSLTRTSFTQTSWGTPLVSSFQTQLGSLFFPQQPLTTPKEYYTNALYMWCKSQNDPKDNCAVEYEDFLGGSGYGLTTGTPSTTVVDPYATGTGSIYTGIGNWVAPYGCAVYGMIAEKSSILQLSGLPISNARLLRHKFTFAYPPQSGTTRTLHTYTQYTRVNKVFLGGRIVIRE